MAREIKVIIDEAGSAKLEALGFTGGVCESTLNELILSVGGAEESEQKKPEYYDNDDSGLMDEIWNNNK
jgi:hypothetical protein